MSRSSVAKWPAIGATRSTRGWARTFSLAKCSIAPKGVAKAISSRTGTTAWSTTVCRMPKSGRAWLSLVCASSPAAAPIERRNGLTAGPANGSRSTASVSPASARSGASRSAWVWYAVYNIALFLLPLVRLRLGATPIWNNSNGQ